MLKFTYTENSFNLEHLARSLEELVTGRTIVAMRVGQRLVVEPTQASFLLPANLPGLENLEAEALRDESETIAICIADTEYVEVSLRGTWLAADSEADEGVFVTSLRDRAEFYILKCWQEARSGVSLLEEVD